MCERTYGVYVLGVEGEGRAGVCERTYGVYVLGVEGRGACVCERTCICVEGRGGGGHVCVKGHS